MAADLLWRSAIRWAMSLLGSTQLFWTVRPGRFSCMAAGMTRSLSFFATPTCFWGGIWARSCLLAR